jgi:hypothetical protein
MFKYKEDISKVYRTHQINDTRLQGCRSLVVVLPLSKWEVMSASPARVKPKTNKIGSG